MRVRMLARLPVRVCLGSCVRSHVHLCMPVGSHACVGVPHFLQVTFFFPRRKNGGRLINLIGVAPTNGSVLQPDQLVARHQASLKL
jgi:hypothetical protein